MSRPRKTLLWHVLDGTFLPYRHAPLLATDDGLGRLPVSEDEPAYLFWRRLLDLQLLYRNTSDPADRQKIASAFRHAIFRGWEPYYRLFDDGEGGDLTWAADESGRFQLVPCECGDCQSSREYHQLERERQAVQTKQRPAVPMAAGRGSRTLLETVRYPNNG